MLRAIVLSFLSFNFILMTVMYDWVTIFYFYQWGTKYSLTYVKI